MAAKEKLLILCIDRDDDLGMKAGIKGPVVGRDKVLDAAVRHGLADAEDTDFNTVFRAVKLFDEMEKKYNLQIALLTGSRNVGIESDEEIRKQLDKVLHAFPAGYAVLVTDGAQDEHVIPIIQSRLRILSVSRVVVKQSEQLESAYYQIKDFLDNTLDDPRHARLFFGLPALLFVLYAFFGLSAQGLRAISFFLACYLFIKAFKLEDPIINAVKEMKVAMSEHRLAFFSYIVGLAFGAFGTYFGYLAAIGVFSLGIFHISAYFIENSIFLYYLGATIAWLGRNLSYKKRPKGKIIAVPIFGFAVSLVVFAATQFIISKGFSFPNFLTIVLVSFLLMAVAWGIEKGYLNLILDMLKKRLSR